MLYRSVFQCDVSLQASDCSYVTASDIDVMSDQYEEEDEDDEDMREMSTPHPLLDTDLTRVAEKFGQLAVDYKCVCVYVYVYWLAYLCVCLFVYVCLYLFMCGLCVYLCLYLCQFCVCI